MKSWALKAGGDGLEGRHLGVDVVAACACRGRCLGSGVVVLMITSPFELTSPGDTECQSPKPSSKLSAYGKTAICPTTTLHRASITTILILIEDEEAFIFSPAPVSLVHDIENSATYRG